MRNYRKSQELVSSILLSLSGKGCESFANERSGSISWVGESLFRPKHKRKNWYAGVKPAPSIDDIPKLLDKDKQYKAIRVSGPGGQHINKTDSAIHAIHIPTDISTVSQDQRFQFANKKIPRLKLTLIFKNKGK